MLRVVMAAVEGMFFFSLFSQHMEWQLTLLSQSESFPFFYTPPSRYPTFWFSDASTIAQTGDSRPSASFSGKAFRVPLSFKNRTKFWGFVSFYLFPNVVLLLIYLCFVSFSLPLVFSLSLFCCNMSPLTLTPESISNTHCYLSSLHDLFPHRTLWARFLVTLIVWKFDQTRNQNDLPGSASLASLALAPPWLFPDANPETDLTLGQLH